MNQEGGREGRDHLSKTFPSRNGVMVVELVRTLSLPLLVLLKLLERSFQSSMGKESAGVYQSEWRVS